MNNKHNEILDKVRKVKNDLTKEQQIKFSIFGALEVCNGEKYEQFIQWANAWIDGSNRKDEVTEQIIHKYGFSSVRAYPNYPSLLDLKETIACGAAMETLGYDCDPVSFALFYTDIEINLEELYKKASQEK